LGLGLGLGSWLGLVQGWGLGSGSARGRKAVRVAGGSALGGAGGGWEHLRQTTERVPVLSP
jgi:hypothetical protein